MSSMAATEAVQEGITQEQLKGGDTIEHSDIIEANHHKQHTEAMAEKHCLNEDPATTAASEELKHATISDRKEPSLQGDDDAITKRQSTEEDRQMGGTEKEATPEAEPSDAQNEAMRERISSPKKKRGRDQEDDTEYSDDSKIDEVTSADGPTVNGGRTTRSEPEKKRHRDTSEDPLKVSKVSEQVPEAKEMAIMHSHESTQTSTATEEASKKSPELAQKPTFGSSFGGDKPQTSSSAFAASGFGALAGSSTSPFGTVGVSKPSVFGGSSSTMSGFGGLSGSKSPTLTSTTTSGFGNLAGDKSSIGFGGGFGGAAASGFGGALGTKSVFGSALGNGFSANTAPKLSSFAAAGKDDVKVPAKPVKAFGAPDSDEEESTDDDEGSDAGEGADEEEGEKQSPEDKKKFKVSKVPVDDGEAGEVTLVSMRAKLYAVESKEIGWKERGVGTLKVNVNKSCVELSESGQPLEGSLDFSSLVDDDKVPAARLIMRQENTHRVILNTIIMQATDFTPKPSTTGAQILFTAFEGEEPKPISMLLKLNEANGRLFTQEIEKVQYELKLSSS